MRPLSVVLICFIVTKAHCWCTGEHYVTCENLSDVKYDGNENWTHLVIGDLHKVPNETLKRDMFRTCPNVVELTIISTVKDVEMFHDFSELDNLAVLRMYNNSLKSTPSILMLSEIVILDLQYNNIVNLERLSAFARISSINLSHNKIRTIYAQIFSIPGLKSLTITHNELTELMEANIFTSSLLYLNMANNKLNHIQDITFQGLDNLEELILSHNKFTTWWIKYDLKKLKMLDLSHNSLSIIEAATFIEMLNLRTLYLDNNLIKQLPLEVFRSYPNQELKLATLHLHNNRLEQLQFLLKDPWPTLREISIGENPWACDCLNLVLTFIHEKGMELTSCDYEYFRNGNFPICIDVNSTQNGECATAEFPLDVYDEFMEVPKNYQC